VKVARSLSDKYETVSYLPQATLYQLAALSSENRGEIISMITDPTAPPVKEIKGRIAAIKAAESKQKQEDEIAAKAEAKSPAAKKAAAKREDERRIEREVTTRAREAKEQTLLDTVATWFDRMPPDLVEEIKTAMGSNGTSEIVDAMRGAVKVRITPEIRQPVVIAAARVPVDCDDASEEIEEPDFSKAA